MSISAPFIARPVATTLLSAGVLLAGVVAFRLLPVAPLPQVDFPTISVQASLPGASPETMAATVATPLERTLGRIAGVTEITSSSSLGSTQIVLQFDLNRNIDSAARDVQAGINAARALLPTGLPSNPTYRKVNPADAPVMIISLTSDTLTRGQMYDAASTVLAQKVSQVSGVGQVTVGGAALPAVRAELNMPALNQMGISLETVRTAIATSNANRPKGSVADATRNWQIYANDQALAAADYIPLIVAYRNGAAVRLGDVAQVVDSVQDIRNFGETNGKPSVQIFVFRQPGANIIETVERVKDLLPVLKASIPAAIDLQVVMERTTTIKASLREVERTLVISVTLVILVVFLFLRSARATLVPAAAVPLSLIGTFAVMYLLGYSLNNLSLMALTIATGFVVDDAIVVLENISRHLERKDGGPAMSPMQAALLGAKEVGFTVLSMSLSLVAVFIPVLAMGGIVGRLFREFAVTLSVAILMSLAVSLTLSPMMCSRLLRAAHAGGAQRVARWKVWTEHAFDALARGYERSLAWALRHSAFMLLLFFATIALNVYLYIIVPKGFFPQQDVGMMFGGIQADQATSFQSMRDKLAAFVDIVRQDPAVQNVVAFTGGGQRNSGRMFVILKPLSERHLSADEVNARLRAKVAHVPGAQVFFSPVQDIRVGGRSANATYQYTLQGDDLDELRNWEPKVREAMNDLPQLVDVNTDAQDHGLQTSLIIDRDSASRLGITASMIDAVLNDAFGQRQVSTIYMPLNQYRVVMEAAPQYWQSPESLRDIYVVTSTGAQVPLSAIARYEATRTPLAVNHQGQFAASTIAFNLAPDVTLSQATDAIDAALRKIGLPTSIRGSFQGTAQVFQQSLANQPILILAALATIYIVLGMLYESYVHPVTILSTLPSAGAGAILALLATGTEFSIIALIGVFLLIGIVKKNAILMVDFAIVAERERGLEPRDAILEACKLRLRPILMTTMAALLGAVPLAVGFGDGAEFRRPLGISIVGGLIASQLLTLYTTPVIYLYLDRARLALARRRARRRAAFPPTGSSEPAT
ncbi:MAG TPA: multidrug efflux RND transporter permease subunit [Burkholderiaceae bacterium]|nr:multidrug efflux RND transporter permease subunit [Burkholderiaceae bacterium]